MTTAPWRGELDDAKRAFWMRLVVPPLVLAAAWMLTGGEDLSHMLSRIFLSMWIHELGHAVTAWMCGFFALPGPWLTVSSDERSAAVRVLVGAALALALYVAFRGERWLRLCCLVLLTLLFVFLSFTLGLRNAHAFITFMGDGGAMLFGALLVATFQASEENVLAKNGLRWGFLVIGAVAWADVSHVWWLARVDVTTIPFGANEGSGLSDPSVLVDQAGWSEGSLVHRYLAVSVVSFLVMVATSLVGSWRAWAHAMRLERALDDETSEGHSAVG